MPPPEPDRRAIRCTPEDEVEYYSPGDVPCSRDYIAQIGGTDSLAISYTIADENSFDPHEDPVSRELLRYRNGQLIQSTKLGGLVPDTDYLFQIVDFVRVREQQFVADLDGDGYLEFAVVSWHPGTALWLTTYILSLKEPIEFWGLGRYEYTGDTFVQLDCMGCSKFNPEACNVCR